MLFMSVIGTLGNDGMMDKMLVITVRFFIHQGNNYIHTHTFMHN